MKSRMILQLFSLRYVPLSATFIQPLLCETMSGMCVMNNIFKQRGLSFLAMTIHAKITQGANPFEIKSLGGKVRGFINWIKTGVTTSAGCH